MQAMPELRYTAGHATRPPRCQSSHELRLPSGRSGPDPYKLQRQIARFGASSAGMPAALEYEGSDGVLVMYNRVTRAGPYRQVRAAARTIRVEVVGTLRRAYAGEPKIGDFVP